MANIVLREKSNCVVCWSSQSGFLKQKHDNKKYFSQITKHCKNCKKHTGNTFPKKVNLISKNKIKGKSKCVICLTEKTFIHGSENKDELEIYLQFFTDWCYKIMKTYCVKCIKNTDNLNSKIFKTKNGRLIMQSKCPVFGIKKSRFVKEQEAKGLLSNLGIKTTLSQILLLNLLI